jgi:hypothetical protein
VARVARAAWPLLVVIAVATMLLCVPPAGSSLYLRCPIYASFGIECPGCGGTRALAALLRGHVGEALRFNALVTIAAPFAAIYATICYRRFLRREGSLWPRVPGAAIYGSMAVAVVFTILRNLPPRWW